MLLGQIKVAFHRPFNELLSSVAIGGTAAIDKWADWGHAIELGTQMILGLTALVFLYRASLKSVKETIEFWKSKRDQ